MCQSGSRKEDHLLRFLTIVKDIKNSDVFKSKKYSKSESNTLGVTSLEPNKPASTSSLNYVLSGTSAESKHPPNTSNSSEKSAQGISMHT